MARTPPGYYLHLIAWAQLGVLMRVYLAELLGSACPAAPWAPCLTSNGTSRLGGAFFTDLPVNVLGSFLMGLLVSSDVLSNSLRHTLAVEAPLAALPVWSPLQQHVALQVGLRTGLCGSLTTFASWLTQMVVMAVGGTREQQQQAQPGVHHTQWVEAAGGLAVGTLAAAAALVVGQHTCLLLYHWLNPGAFIPFGSPAPEQRMLDESTVDEAHAQAAAAAAAGARGVQHATAQPQQTYPQARLSSSSSAGSAPGGASLRRLRTVSSTRQGSTTIVLVQEELGLGAAQLQQQQQQQQQQQSDACTQPPQQQQQQQHKQGGVNGAAAPTPLQPPASSSAAVIEIDEVAAPSASLVVWLVDAAAVVSIVVLTGVSLWRVVQGSRPGAATLANRDAPFAQQWFWWSVLFGPLGCYGRYYLSRFNGALHGRWKWFPAGTFAANIAACVIDYVMKVVPVRHAVSDVSLAVLLGVVGGVGGCLSTVSTWVVEIQRLLLSFPSNAHGYQYVMLSLGTAMALGLLIYGLPVWTL